MCGALLGIDIALFPGAQALFIVSEFKTGSLNEGLTAGLFVDTMSANMFNDVRA